MVERWSPQQDAALREAARWLQNRDRQVFRLFGFAGTGKTTLARHLAEGVEGSVCFAAFTGKAALVMRSRGCPDARTIHSLIYRPQDIDAEEPSFVLNADSDASSAQLIVIDECSMVDETLGNDLLSFGKPVLVLGDPAQLPPVKGGGFFTAVEPDFMLTEIHRQAAGDPIIRMSMEVREGRRIALGSYGDSRVIARRDIDGDAVTAADQTLVGLNRTRRAYNRRLREILGFHTAYPESGDKLVCLKNDPQKGLLNGGLWRTKTAANLRRGRLRMTAIPEDGPAAGPAHRRCAAVFRQ